MTALKKHKTKIMVVEDDISDHTMLCDYLASSGYEVVSVRDARNVFERIQVTRPDIVFIALMLNDFISGDELVEKFKADPEFNSPIVGMSSQVNTDSEYFYSLCDFQLAKPLTIANINNIISQIFSGENK